MPYRLSDKGFEETHLLVEEPRRRSWLTDYQIKALDFLNSHYNDEIYHESSEIAQYYGLSPQAMRGPLHALFLKGLVEKEE
jgi:DNA-binding IscR family transcriptional regulator